MNVFRGILGLIFLFLGRELTFMFAGGFAALFAIRLAPLLPAAWPFWAHIATIAATGLIFAGLAVTNERFGYILSGFVSGAYMACEYFAPGQATLPLFPFIAGSGIGALIMGFLTEWAMMVISSLIGAYFVSDLIKLRLDLKMMVTGGLFMLGALTQVIMRRMQQK